MVVRGYSLERINKKLSSKEKNDLYKIMDEMAEKYGEFWDTLKVVNEIKKKTPNKSFGEIILNKMKNIKKNILNEINEEELTIWEDELEEDN